MFGYDNAETETEDVGAQSFGSFEEALAGSEQEAMRQQIHRQVKEESRQRVMEEGEAALETFLECESPIDMLGMIREPVYKAVGQVYAFLHVLEFQRANADIPPEMEEHHEEMVDEIGQYLGAILAFAEAGESVRLLEEHEDIDIENIDIHVGEPEWVA